MEVLSHYLAPEQTTNLKKLPNLQYLPLSAESLQAVSFIGPQDLESKPPGAPYDRLISAGEMECTALFNMTYPHLALGAVVTMYCQYSEPLVELWKHLH